jgi:hypothetical protein
MNINSGFILKEKEECVNRELLPSFRKHLCSTQSHESHIAEIRGIRPDSPEETYV